MSQYIPISQTSTSVKHGVHEDFNIRASSNLDDAQNRDATGLYLPSKRSEGSLLDPEAFRRLSISTLSSLGRARSVSPYPSRAPNPQTWRESCRSFWHRNQGLFFVVFSQFFGALMNATTRLLELEGEGMTPFQILFVRQGLTVIFCTTWLRYTGVENFLLGKREIRGLLVARATFGFLGIYGMYYSLQYLPVADTVVITFLAPSVASYGCYLFLSEAFPRSAQIASLVSLLGVFLIARPTSLFSSSSPPPVSPSNTTVPYDFPVPTSTQRFSAVGVALIGVLGSAGAFTSLRWIGSRAHPLVSVNYFSAFCTLISFLALSLSKPLHLSSTLTFQLPSSPRQWSMLLFLGVCGFVMQYLLTRGLVAGGRAGGARATNMIYTNMLFALALDRVVFGVNPSWWSLCGSGLIFGGAVCVAIGQEKEKKEEGAARMEDEEIAMLGRSSGNRFEPSTDDEGIVERNEANGGVSRE